MDDQSDTPASPTRGPSTLDEIFSIHARVRPDAVALCDPPDRALFTDGAPRLLTYAEMDRAIAGTAARLRELDLPVGSAVGLQMPNTAEGVVAFLAVLRAGLIPAPLPLLWRRVELARALERIGARAVITCGRIGETDHTDLALHVAADTFSIRYVCGFGSDLLDAWCRSATSRRPQAPTQLVANIRKGRGPQRRRHHL